MNLGNILYGIVIGPIEMLFEVIFAIANRVIHIPGLTIIVLSLVVNLLVLPLYKRADEMQEEQRKKDAELEHWTKHIKKTFKGDERYMMLQTYYRQNNYKPTDSLKGTVSLLLQIPFFMAAYNFLSHLELLQGVSFGPIADLGAPDAMLTIGGVAINVLPIAMTLINVVSGAIYTHGFPWKAKVQLYGMALLFLVLLYDSPAGLVFYWTLNNVFSLVKNIINKLKHPGFAVGAISALAGVGVIVSAWTMQEGATEYRKIAETVIGVAMMLPLVACAVRYFFKSKKEKKPVELAEGEKALFYLGALFLAILIGFVIPLSVIKASPEEFMDRHFVESPLIFVANAACLAFGLFVVWGSIFYSLATKSAKCLMGLAAWLAVVMAMINFTAFSGGFGEISNALIYNNDIMANLTMKKRLLNLGVLAIAMAIAALLYRYQKRLIKAVYIVTGIAMLVTGAMDVVATNETIANSSLLKGAKDEPAITMSTEGKNVVVIMMDRAINSFVPYVFNERPDVAKQFEGFTYYPNTISYGSYTNVGTPLIYGGYDYKPEKINARQDVLLKDKQNEALKVMPLNFLEAGAKVNVGDPTYANYGWVPDLTIFDEYPEINKYLSMGAFDAAPEVMHGRMRATLMRNLIQYSFMKASPLMIQKTIYNDGKYNNPNSVFAFLEEDQKSEETKLFASEGQSHQSESKVSGVRPWFMSSYYALKNYPGFTYIKKNGDLNFTMISNDTTHEPTVLKEPEYEPALSVDNTEFDAAHSDRFNIDGVDRNLHDYDQMSHYHINMAAAIQLGKYFDYLRENKVFDNTRIIIVSDHGFCMGMFDEYTYTDEFHYGNNLQCEQALLMVKDFGSQEFTTSNDFMTTGDVPYLAMQGLVDNPKNPANGNPINMDGKKGRQNILYTDWHTDVNAYQFDVGEWYSVENDVFDIRNWRYEGHGVMPEHRYE